MPRCIFCDTELTSKTKPEHILLDAFGGRKKTQTVDCSDCNSNFGNTIDAQLANQTRHIRNLLQLPNGSSGQAPTLQRMKSGKRVINISGDGTMKIVDKPFSIEKISDDQFNIQFNLNDVADVEKYLPHIAAYTSIPLEKLRAQLGPAEIVMVEQRPDLDPYSLSFGGEAAIRGAAKACLVLWATLVGNDEVKSDPYQYTRKYILEGGEYFTATRTHLDVRPVPSTKYIIETYSPVFNMIYVASDSSGQVIGHYTLNNIIAFQIVLAESGGTPNRRIALVSNPVAPGTWSDDTIDSIDIPFEWLASPDGERFEITRDRLANLMQFYFDKTRPGEISRIVDDVFADFDVNDDNTPITIDVYDAVVPLLAERVALHALGLPYEKKMTYEQWQSLRPKMPPKDDKADD